MSPSSIHLLESLVQEPSHILQLYPHLELFIEGDPPRNTLFVLERAPLSLLNDQTDRLLLIDPPTSAATKFRLVGEVTSLVTGESQASDLPQLQTQSGGVAHIRLGEHFLDIYSQRNGNVVYFPALGILCSGLFGSDAALPQLGEGSDGGEELATLRLLAQLVKRKLQLFIPQIGSLIKEPTAVMQRLAEDVGYLHGLQRVIPHLAQSGEQGEHIASIADSLLPSTRQTALCQTIHAHNIAQLLGVHQ